MTTYFRDCLQALAAKAERQAGEFPAIPANGHAPGELPVLRYLVLLKEFSQTRMSHLLDRPQDLDRSGGLVTQAACSAPGADLPRRHDRFGRRRAHRRCLPTPLALPRYDPPRIFPTWCVQARGAEGAAEPSPS